MDRIETPHLDFLSSMISYFSHRFGCDSGTLRRHFDTVMKFIREYDSLPEDTKRSLEDIYANFPYALLGPPCGVGDVYVFLSVCFILAKQTNHSALKAWIEIDRGQDKTTLYEDKDTIDVSITRTIGHTTSTITSHLKAAGVYSEPPREMWYYIPRRQHNRERGSQLTGQNSSTTNFDASKGLDRAATPPLPHLSEISGLDQDYSQQSGSAVSAEASLQYTSPTTSAIRDFFNQQAGSASDAQPPPQPVSSAQTFVGLSEQQASDGQRTPSLSSPPHTLLGLSDEQSEPASDKDRSPLSLSAATTLTANSFSEQ